MAEQRKLMNMGDLLRGAPQVECKGEMSGDGQKKVSIGSLLLGVPDIRTPKERLHDELIASLRREVAGLESKLAGTDSEPD